MKEFIEKLIGRLEEISVENTCSDCPYKAKCDEVQEHINDETTDLCGATIKALSIEIVNQLAEEYNNGWIPVSSGNPKETGLYQVTVDDNDEPVITAMYLAEVDIWSYHAGYGNYMKVLAWRSLPQPYQPKGE